MVGALTPAFRGKDALVTQYSPGVLVSTEELRGHF